MPLTVADIMETSTPTVEPEDTVETVLRVMRDHDLPGIVVINPGGRCVGIITDADLVMTGEDADLHLPHYFELFGGLVFLEPLGHFEERLRKATAALARDLMTEDPVTIEPSATVQEAARTDLALQAQPAARRRPRPPRGRRHAGRRARGADPRVVARPAAVDPRCRTSITAMLRPRPLEIPGGIPAGLRPCLAAPTCVSRADRHGTDH